MSGVVIVRKREVSGECPKEEFSGVESPVWELSGGNCPREMSVKEIFWGKYPGNVRGNALRRNFLGWKIRCGNFSGSVPGVIIQGKCP